jgi:serine/threonine-protein kinase
VPPRAYQRVALSPDGTRLALDVRDEDLDIWTWDLAHETLTRLTTDKAIDNYPVWTADSKRIIFGSARDGAENIYSQLADGSGPAERLMTSPRAQSPLSIAPDGKGLLFRDTRSSPDLFLLHLDGTLKADPLVESAFSDQNGIVSPDGKWLAYDSNPSGKSEVFVRPYPNVAGGQWQVSKSGGRGPLWSPNGRELFYVDDANKLLVAPVLPPAPSGAFNFGPVTTALESPYFQSVPTRNYDISRDGKRFLMIKSAASTGTQTQSGSAQNIVVVLHWNEELKARVPIK